MKVLISKKTGNYYYYNENSNQDLHTKEGFVKKEELLTDKSVVITDNTQREFIMFNANNYDLSKKYKRGPQIITPKDLGYVLSRSGINKSSKIVEAGGGSGAATCFFANICKEVKCYEIKQEHCDIIEKNIKLMNLENVELICSDLAQNIQNEKDIDLLFLDLPEPCEILSKDISGVKRGCYIVCYVPSITHIQDITKLISETKELYLEEISEVILRHWRVWEKVSRPEHRKEIDHTAFLVFIRKV